MNDHREIERAYELADADPIPDLSRLPGVARVTAPLTTRLEATYLDTHDLALVRGGVTLRRRAGGVDEGWHLKVPTGDGRDEVHRPLGPTRPPAALTRLVTARSRGRALVPVAVITTERTTRLLLDAEDRVVAELADDRVAGRDTAEAPDHAAATRWRELEVELGPAAYGPRLLDDVDALLAESGIVPRTEQRKVGSVLARRLAAYDAPPSASEAGREGPAGAVLHARLAELVEELRRRDCDVRRRVPDGVHQLRVTSRRLRGALATYRPLVDRTRTDPLREELRWLARTLGDGRDAEVALGRLRGLVSEQPAALVLGPVRRRLERHYATRMRAARSHGDEVLSSRRYLRLLARLDALVADPPFTELAADPADEVLRARVRKDAKRLRRRVAAALAAPAAERDTALHDARKAAKRLRYACETLEPQWGKDAKALRKAAQSVTQVLGERQDAAVSLADLRRIALEADRAGENAFTYGRLHAEQQARALELETDFDGVWAEASRKRLRSWLG